MPDNFEIRKEKENLKPCGRDEERHVGKAVLSVFVGKMMARCNTLAAKESHDEIQK